MHAILTMALKDLRLLWRDRFGMFWVLVFPLLQALFFGAIFRGDGKDTAKMTIGVVDEDQSQSTQSFIKRLRDSSALSVEPPLDANGKPATPLTPDQARDMVRTGNLVAFVIVKKNTDENEGFTFAEMPKLEVGIDPSRKAEAGYLQGILTEASFKGLQDAFTNPAGMRERIEKASKQLDVGSGLSAPQRIVLKTFFTSLDQFLGSVDPKVYHEGPQAMGGANIQLVDITREKHGTDNSFEITFPSAMLWGVIGCTAGFAISLVTERRTGTLLRLRVAPLQRTQILAGKALACFLACSGVILLLLTVGHFVFGVRTTHPALLAMAIFSTAICFVGLTMLFATMGSTEQGVAGVGWAVMLVFAMIGGGMIPLIAMPQWMTVASNFSPVKWGIYSLEGAIWRGFSFAEMLQPCGILVAIGVICFAIGVQLIKRRET